MSEAVWNNIKIKYEYFSKLYLEWKPVKVSDSIEKLKKYGYKIRERNEG